MAINTYLVCPKCGCQKLIRQTISQYKKIMTDMKVTAYMEEPEGYIIQCSSCGNIIQSLTKDSEIKLIEGRKTPFY